MMRAIYRGLILNVGVFAVGSAAFAASHAADRDNNRLLEMPELLRVIQFFNSDGLHCDASGEDGFAPGPGDRDSCDPHDSDYAPQDWFVTLSELLRAVQFFNSDGYHRECDTEDGWQPTRDNDCPEADAAPGVEILLPDLIFDEEELSGAEIDTTEIPGRVLYRFDTSLPNIGLGPYRLRLTGVAEEDGRFEVDQIMFREDGEEIHRDAGTFKYNPANRHMETAGWTSYRIREILPNNEVGEILAEGSKDSVRITSSTIYNPGQPNRPPRGFTANNGEHGISVGYTDLYPRRLEFQWIDVTELDSGTYWLEVVVDPADHILESNEANNVARRAVSLTIPDV